MNKSSPIDVGQVLGFGVSGGADHYFIVDTLLANQTQVLIKEHCGSDISGQEDIYFRVLLKRQQWDAISAVVQRHFNERLAKYGLKRTSWKAGHNRVDRLLGRELCVLAWAIEDLEGDDIQSAVRAWMALRPEDRWWLYSKVVETTKGLDDKRGWRVALRYALS